MVNHAYGNVLKDRNNVNLALRELMNVVSLASEPKNHSPQIVSHMRGFIKVFNEEEPQYRHFLFQNYPIHFYQPIKTSNDLFYHTDHNEKTNPDKQLPKLILRNTFDILPSIYHFNSDSLPE
jgi:hypothetical protein